MCSAVANLLYEYLLWRVRPYINNTELFLGPQPRSRVFNLATGTFHIPVHSGSGNIRHNYGMEAPGALAAVLISAQGAV